MRKVLSSIIGAIPGAVIVGTAYDGRDGLAKIRSLRPDIVTLDIEMPNLDGLGVLQELRLLPASERPSVLICSTLTSAGSHAALKAMRLGAADVILKDPHSLGAGGEAAKGELTGKIKALFDSKARQRTPAPIRASSTATAAATSSHTAPARTLDLAGKVFDVILIGSSTGGPPVLEQILMALPADLPMPVVVAQHMPRMFTKSMSERLDEECALSVVHAEHEMPLLPGAVYITPGGMHSRVKANSTGRATLIISEEPRGALYKPSVDELFASGAALGAKALGIVLTGMGADGAIGAKAMHASRGMVIAQDAESCVVYGMPRAVVEAGAACAQLTPAQICAAVRQLAPSGQGMSSTSSAA